ncbi:hypothetical protein TVAG_355080 [Trichomonas vaginalis G3]|uniref:Uncharacterized protein n=1 Tax=Trichomonas vaginalis (strain ATCC PRA-98 / G3) TaxID=412133 RepID=A2EFZ3_TRIV3|nr:hypothetical protein TVAG_355080 [Trichomonas vaginalis G3]|eukprot:XP_001320672.1 hypothetical protein [Trichomonas vaginalis G3]
MQDPGTNAIFRLRDRQNQQNDNQCREISTDFEVHNKLLNRLGDQSIPIEDRMNNFGEFCKTHRFVINEEQADYLIQLLNSARDQNNETLMINYLHAIELIIGYREEFTNELFLVPQRLEPIMQCFPLSYAYNIVGLLASTDEEAATTIFQYSKQYDFESTINDDQSIMFLTTFLKYQSLQEKILPTIQKVIRLGYDSDGQLRFECLRFIYFALKQSTELCFDLVEYQDFYLIFQKPAEDAQTNDMMLLILREITFKTQNPLRSIIQTNLIYFILFGLQSDDACTLSYAIDIIGDLAEFGGQQGTEILIQNNIIEKLFKIIEDKALQNRLCAVSALLRIFLNSPLKFKVQILEKDFLSILSDHLPLMSDKECDSSLIILNMILRVAETNNETIVLDSIYGDEELYSVLSEISESSENRVYAESILSRFK